jgi:ribosome-binding ATPase
MYTVFHKLKSFSTIKNDIISLMKLSVGIVGLPNVGKSTLFNALLKKQVALEANYPFATIDPNVGIVEVPDARLPKLAEVVNTKKIVPAAVEFYDIAGLVKGASTGEGLGNKFLSHIREVAALTHVVRLFEDKDIIHVANEVKPIEDIKIIEEELMLADLSTLQKQREPKGAAPKEAVAAYHTAMKVKEALNNGMPVRAQGLSHDELEQIRPLSLITAKPVFFCFNCSLEQLDKPEETKKQIADLFAALKYPASTKYLLFNPLEEQTLDHLIQTAYETLHLISFLTAGELEVRAWTMTRDTMAPQAAAVIHTDFEKKFIKADIVKYEDFLATHGWHGAREQGKVLTVGRDHVMQEGDVVEFKIGA